MPSPMQIFDSLPAEVRAVMRDAVYPYDPETVAYHVHKHGADYVVRDIAKKSAGALDGQRKLAEDVKRKLKV